MGEDKEMCTLVELGADRVVVVHRDDVLYLSYIMFYLNEFGTMHILYECVLFILCTVLL